MNTNQQLLCEVKSALFKCVWGYVKVLPENKDLDFQIHMIKVDFFGHFELDKW